MMKKRLIIVDMSSFIFRAFYAIRPLSSPAGLPVNAVYGVLSMILKLIQDFRPSHLFLARDGKDGSFRNQLYPEYKANRSAPPDDLLPQFALVDQLVCKMGLPNLHMKNYEADDVIGSAVTQWKDDFDEVYIVSGDKDLMQFVGGHVFMLDTKIDKIYGEGEVFEKMGVRPDQIVDYLSIIGDSSDNIPGMKGIGAKGAAKLLAEFGTLEKCVEGKASFKNKRLIEAFEHHLEDAYLSKSLVKIVLDLPLGIGCQDVQYTYQATPALIAFLEELGFKTIIKRVKDLEVKEKIPKGGLLPETQEIQQTPETVEALPRKSDFILHHLTDEKEIDSLMENIRNGVDMGPQKKLALSAQFQGQDFYDQELISLSLSWDGKSGYSIDHPQKREEMFKTLWRDRSLEIVGADMKRDIAYFFKSDTDIGCRFFDCMMAHYLIDVEGNHQLEYLLGQFLPDQHFINPGEEVFAYFHLRDVLEQKLRDLNLQGLFFEIETPLIPVLACLEKAGVAINIPYFHDLAMTFQSELKTYENRVAAYVDEPINLRSPKQVAHLLFEKLNLPNLKKTKTGFSTDSEVLEELEATQASEVPGLILRFRGLEKLLSTYVLVLPGLVNPRTRKIHTTFQQMVTATGRLSSDRPNLQNIPVRTENGKKVRRGFVAGPGHLLLSADYSQVELRILAHFSGDKIMANAFRLNQDIHRQTASEVLGIPLNEVTEEGRDKAKAVNFGLMYGQSSFGLSRALKISRQEAKDYILQYFGKFHAVKSYLDSLKEKCAQTGYAETLFGRKRFLSDIHSQNRNVKGMAERLAINTPIQGTAADIIKVAMLKIHHRLQREHFQTKMLLQVHDELIFEVPENEVEKVKALVVEEMETAVTLSVPLKVDLGVGRNWLDLD